MDRINEYARFWRTDEDPHAETDAADVELTGESDETERNTSK